MSGASAFSIGATIASVLLRTNRSWGAVIPDVTVEEQHSDVMAITEHPVEQGAAITDHAYMQQPTVTIRAAWSNASGGALGSLVSSVSSAASTALAVVGGIAGGEGRVKQIYSQLLSLQAQRSPITLTTGKRTYPNMLIESLGVFTDRTTEYALAVTATFKQITIVSTSTTSLAPQANQAMPQQTSAVQNTGTNQAVPSNSVTTQSVLKSVANFIGGK